jgi:HK97 family phage portal protein
MNLFQRVLKNFLGQGGNLSALSWDLPRRWNKKQLLEQFNRYVYRIVSAISQDFAKTEYKLLRKVGKKYTELETHEFINILENPNSLQSGFQFRELHSVYMELAGESFWFKAGGKGTGKPKEFYLIRPDLMDVEINNDNIGSIKRYILTKLDSTKQYFEPQEIIHHKLPNPINPYRGFGVIEAAMTYLQTEKYASDWTKNSIFNSGRPSGIINLKGKINDDQFKQLQGRFRQEYTGTGNTGKTLILKGFDGIDWQKLGMDLEGIDLQKVKDLTREDIMFMFGASNTIMGITDDVNRANSREMRGVWMENIIKPKIDRFVNQLQYSVIKVYYGEQYKLTYQDPNPETIEDRLTEWEKGVDKWLTKNEIRRERNEIIGSELPDVEGGDEIWQALMLSPMSKKKEEPKEPEKEPEKKPEKPKEPEEEKEKTIVEIEKPKEKKKELTRKEKGELFRVALYDQQEQWLSKYQEKVNEVFNLQRKEILEKNKKGIAEWAFDKILYAETWRGNLYPLVVSLMVSQAAQAFDFEGVQGELEITPALEKAIYSRLERTFGDVDDDTLMSINEEITEAMKQGESLGKMRKRIEAIFDEATTTRAERIARTETIYDSNFAAVEAYKQMPTVSGKEWLANPGACEICQAIDGKITGLNTNFLNIGESIEGVEGGILVADYENIAFPPMHPNSYHKDTEVYTRKGFELVKDVKIGDEVLSLNPDTRDLEWVKVDNLISHEQDKLISFKSINFDLEVTPDHDILYQKRWDKRQGRKTLEFIHAKDLPPEAIIYRSSEWIGEDIEFETFGMDKKDFCRFMAYWLSDGSVNKHYVHIAQYDKKQEMGEYLYSMNLDVKETKGGFRIKNTELADYLHQFGHANEKFIPEEIKQLPKEYIKEFLDAYVFCDGHIKKGKEWKGGKFRDTRTYFTTSKRMADDLGELILKIGRRPSYKIQKPTTVEHNNGTFTGNYDLWVVTECYSQNSTADKMEIKEIDYSDKVYCVELERNHTLYVRKNGKCTWCGNCRCTTIPVNNAEFRQIRIKELEKMLLEYKDLDKRTKEAKDLLTEIKDEKEKMELSKKELNNTLGKFEKLLE